MTWARTALVLAYALASVPLASTVVQWSAAIHCRLELGHSPEYGERYELSQAASLHTDVAGATMLIVLPVLLAAPLAIALAHRFTSRGGPPFIIWAVGVGSWWASIVSSSVFHDFVNWYLD